MTRKRNRIWSGVREGDAAAVAAGQKGSEGKGERGRGYRGSLEVANQKTRQTILYQNEQQQKTNDEQKKNSFFKFQSQLLNLCYMVMVIVVI